MSEYNNLYQTTWLLSPNVGSLATGHSDPPLERYSCRAYNLLKYRDSPSIATEYNSAIATPVVTQVKDESRELYYSNEQLHCSLYKCRRREACWLEVACLKLKEEKRNDSSRKKEGLFIHKRMVTTCNLTVSYVLRYLLQHFRYIHSLYNSGYSSGSMGPLLLVSAEVWGHSHQAVGQQSPGYQPLIAGIWPWVIHMFHLYTNGSMSPACSVGYTPGHF